MTAVPTRFQTHTKLFFGSLKAISLLLFFFSYMDHSRRNIHHFLSRVRNTYTLQFYSLITGFILKEKKMYHRSLRMRYDLETEEKENRIIEDSLS